MLQDIKEYCNEISQLAQELETYESYKEQVEYDLKELENKYQKSKYSYKEYSNIKSKILKGKTKKGLFEYYNAYILSLIKKIDFLNTQIFSEVYTGKAIAERLAKEVLAEAPQLEEKTKKTAKKEIKKITPILTKSEIIDNVKTNIESVKKDAKESPTAYIPRLEEEMRLKPKKEKVKAFSRTQSLRPLDLGFDKLKSAEMPKPLPKRSLDVPSPKKGIISKIFKTTKKKTLFDELQEKEEIKPAPLKLSGILNIDFIKNLRSRIKEKSEFLSDETKITPTILKVKGSEYEEELKTGISPTLMTLQAEKIKNILLHKKVKVYSPSSIGFIANIFVRRIVLNLMDKFPRFFKDFYFTLRYANIKMLSNTYVNIMVFISILSFLVMFPLSFIILSFRDSTFAVNLFSALFLGVAASGVSFGYFYYSPNLKINKRIRSINTNMPFAIDHMSSVASSGVPPATMFKLIADSKEYGEVSVEVEKISNYIEFFGYDVITAMRSAAAICPSKNLKEFFDGFISTVESGGDLKNYLGQKSKEALLSYRLERQKYVEAVSTYSDIYTGVLIAAPLFFISTLALVSMLGGEIGGLPIGTVIGIGTYIVIPVLNMLFIVFLQMNQPQI